MWIQMWTGFGSDDDNVCKPCSSFPNKNFLLDGNCVEACPASYKAQDYMGTKNVCRFITVDPTCTEPEIYCKNDSICSIQPSGNLFCECKNSFYGARCELSPEELAQLANQVNDLLNNINSIDLNDASSVAKISQLSEILKSAPQIATPEMSTQLINMASDALRRSIENPGSNPEEVYKIIDTAYLTKTLT